MRFLTSNSTGTVGREGAFSMCLSPHFVPTPNGGSPVVLVQAPPRPQATPPSGTIPAASAPAAAAETMSPGPREAPQDGDELRAGVESLISGLGGWGGAG